jgi:hypothetical protein
MYNGEVLTAAESFTPEILVEFRFNIIRDIRKSGTISTLQNHSSKSKLQEVRHLLFPRFVLVTIVLQLLKCYKNWSVTLEEEWMLGVVNNSVLKIMFGPKGKEMTKERCRILYLRRCTIFTLHVILYYTVLSGLNNWEYGRRYPSRWPRGTLYPQKLTLTSPTSCFCSVGIVRSRTQDMEYTYYIILHYIILWIQGVQTRICSTNGDVRNFRRIT